jgi:hypothetical protein
MKHAILGGVAVALLLGACGGGGSGSATIATPTPTPTPAPTPAPPQVYHLPVQTAGDVASYLFSGVLVDSANVPTGPVARYYTNSTTTSASSAGFVLTETQSSTSARRIPSSFTAEGGIQKDGQNADKFDCQFSPAYFEVPATVTAGLAWDNRTVYTCTPLPGFTLYGTSRRDTRSQGSFVAFEPLTVAAGSFDTVKVHVLKSETSLDGTSLSDITEWRDMVSGLVVKSVVLTTDTLPSNPTVPIHYSYSTELVGYAHAASGRQKVNVERYAGSWSGAYAGGGSGSCAMVISQAGLLSGTCSAAGASAFTIAGTIDAQGVASFNLQAGGVSGPTFTGKFQSPLDVGGVWSSPGFNGTWQMTHK